MYEILFFNHYYYYFFKITYTFYFLGWIIKNRVSGMSLSISRHMMIIDNTMCTTRALLELITYTHYSNKRKWVKRAKCTFYLVHITILAMMFKIIFFNFQVDIMKYNQIYGMLTNRNYLRFAGQVLSTLSLITSMCWP